MNSIVIILTILIIVLLYVLYAYFMNTSSQLSATADLKQVVPAVTSINNPKNTRYGYSIWVYVKSWDNNSNKVIFSRNGNLSLYLSKMSPTLNLDVIMNDNSKQTMMITNNFPLQRWVCICISADNQYFDCYLDGKLVKSQRMYVQSPGSSTGIMPASPPDSSTPIYLGNSDTSSVAFTAFDAVVASFKRHTSPVDPQTAWTNYTAGNGNNSIMKALSPYGVNLNILKDNVQQSQITIW
jgi:hypothetical protein